MAQLNLRVSADPSQLKKDLDEMTSATKKGAEEMGASVDKLSFKQSALNAQYDLAVNKAATLAARHGQESIEALKAASAAERLALKVKEASAATAASATTAHSASVRYNGMQNSVNQITREMPAFTNSVQTGFMAISNNLPIFFDQIAAMKAANKELAASGQATKSIASQVASSIFSWGTALSVGITILTMYGAKIIEAIIPTDKLAESTKELTRATDYANKAFDIEERRLRALGVSEDNLIKKRKERIKLNIKIADQELEQQMQELAKARGKAMAAENFSALAGPIAGGLMKMFTPSNQDISDLEDKYNEIKLKRADFIAQIAELDKKSADIAKKEAKKKVPYANGTGVDIAEQVNTMYANQVAGKIKPITADLVLQPNMKLFLPKTAAQEADSNITNFFNILKESISNGKNIIVEAAKSLAQSLQSLTGSLATGIGESIGTALANGQSVMDAMMASIGKSLAQFAVNYGASLVALSVPMMLVGNPMGFVYAGAGVALIAAGSYVSAKMGSGGTSGGGSSSGGGSTSSGATTGWGGNGGFNTGFGATANNLQLSTRVSGRDLEIVNGRQGYFSRRVTG